PRLAPGDPSGHGARDPRPSATAADGTGGGRPVRPSVAGLSDDDAVSLYTVGAVRSISAGECLIAEGSVADGCYVVLTGSLALRATVSGAVSDLGLVQRGECVGLGGQALPYAL